MISQKESDALNLIRWLSTIAIVVCHLLQGHGSIYAWVFNIGVQVFFFLSGFLYGNKRITSVSKFYTSRIIKLYVPYLLWVLVAVALLTLFAPEAVSATRVVRQLLMRGNMPGLSHLWFMYVIFLCYLFLPLIDNALTRRRAWILSAAVLLIGVLLAFRYSARYAWVLLYYVGYLCGRYPDIRKYVLAAAAVLTVGILSYVSFDVQFFKSETSLNNCLHAAAGAGIFLAIYMLCKQVTLPQKFSQILTTRGGYEVYLTHHIFILGPLSLLFITPYNWLNILIILILTFVASCLLIKVGDFASRKLNEINPYKHK